MDGVAETLLVFAARRDHLERVIAPALDRGEIVLCDRFTDATFAYQGFGRGQDSRMLRVARGLGPGRTAAGPHALVRRRAAGGRARRAEARAADRFEAEDLAFFERVRAGYRARMREAPARIVRIDAATRQGDVRRQVDAAGALRRSR